MSQPEGTVQPLLPIADVQGEYLSPPPTTSLVARLLPSLSFYVQFIYYTLNYSQKARQGRYDDAQWYQSSLDVLHLLERVGIEIQITGLHLLEQAKGPAVFVANHMSTLETIILPGILQPYKDCTFVVKRAIVEYPVFKDIMLARDPIVVDRVNPREDLTRVLQQGAEILSKGRSIIVFPQTTRTVHFDSTQFNTIGIKLARAAGVPIVPVALRSDAWGIGRWIKEFGRIDPTRPVRIAFGAPLAVEGRGNVTHQAVVRFISEHLASWDMEVVQPSLPTPSTAGSSVN